MGLIQSLDQSLDLCLLSVVDFITHSEDFFFSVYDLFFSEESIIFFAIFSGIFRLMSNHKDGILSYASRKLYVQQIRKVIKQFPVTDQGHEGICWSHAISAAIYLSLSRIQGRKVPSFLP